MKKKRERPEAKIQKALVEYLEDRGWLVEETHGSKYQSGLPDVYCFHVRYGHRWIDCKVKGRYSFTPAQRDKWPKWEAKGLGIWIIVAASEEEYDKLFNAPNWREYWKPSYGTLADLNDLLEGLNDETPD